MSIALITPQKLSGVITAPPSKSDTHRAIICALMSRGVCEIYPIDLSNDVMSTILAARALGAIVNVYENRLTIDSRDAFSKRNVTINCNESASTLRLLLPIVSAFGIDACFDGKESLKSRPMSVYKDILPDSGVRCNYDGKLPFKISGRLCPGQFILPGNVSSQFVSGMLFALPILHSNSEIIVTGTRESASYIDMTIKTMTDFGVNIVRTESGFLVPGNQKYRPTNYNVEGDWSQAAYFLAAGAIGSSVCVRGLNMNSLQGDRAILSILQRMGAGLELGQDSVIVSPGTLVGLDVFAAPIPDLVPIVSVLGACANGTTQIFGASRLRYKESDRLRAMYDGLYRLGVRAINSNEGLVIKGKRCFQQANLNGFRDHRIVMALAIAAIRTRGKVSLTSAECICKSYPSFFDDYIYLGGKVDVLNV